MKHYILDGKQVEVVLKLVDFCYDMAGQESKDTLDSIRQSLAKPVEVKAEAKDIRLSGVDKIFLASADEVIQTIHIENKPKGFLN